MPKYLMMFVLLISFSANSNELVEKNVKILCGDTKKMFETLKKSYSEIPVILGIGKTEDSPVTTLWLNVKTSSWTILQTYNEESCLITGGSKLRISKLLKEDAI